MRGWAWPALGATGRAPAALPTLAGITSGLLYALSLPKADQGWLAWFCLLPCLLLVLRGTRRLSRRQVISMGLGHGLVAGLGRVYWVAETLQLYGGLTHPEALLTTALLIGYLALYPVVFFVLCRSLRHAGAGFPWLAAALWTLLDWVQTWMLSGFPWALLGYSQYRYGPVLQLAAITGVHGLTFLIVFANATLAWILAGHTRRLVAGAAAALLMGTTFAYGVQRLARPPATADALRIGIVQGNIRQDLKWQRLGSEATAARYDSLTRVLLREAGSLDLILWPETALPFRFDSPSRQRLRQVVTNLAREAGAPLLVGSLGSHSPTGNPGLYNRSFLIDGRGEIRGAADKVHLVPFGEYLPFPWLFAYMQGLIAESGAFTAGDAHTVLSLPGMGTRLGVFICYESIFPEITRSLVRDGADLLVNTTNDAWFGTTAAPHQHLAMVVLRAVEAGRTILRAANTGISGAIEPDGRIVRATGLFETTVLEISARPSDELTTYARYGDLVFPFSGLLLAMAAALAWRRRSRELQAEIARAQDDLVGFARHQVPLRRTLILLPGYDSAAERWSPFYAQLHRCFTNTADAVRLIDLRRDLPLAQLGREVGSRLPAPGGLDFVGHSLGGLVAGLIAHPRSRVFGLAVPIYGTGFAAVARWLRLPFPRLLCDLAPGSAGLAAARERITALANWHGLRLAGDPLSHTPTHNMAGSHRSYRLPLLVSPIWRHRYAHADPRIIRDIIVALRAGLDAAGDHGPK